MREVFVSYSHHDTAYVEKLAKRLRKARLTVWLDSEIDYGSRWPAVIEEHLGGSAAVIVVMSSAAKASEWVQNELEFAKNKGKPMFPILLEGDAFLQFQTTQYADARDGRMPSAAFIERLRATVRQTRVGQGRTPRGVLREVSVAARDQSSFASAGTGDAVGSGLAGRIQQEVALLADRLPAAYVEVSGSRLAHAHATPQESNTWRGRIQAIEAGGYALSLTRPIGQPVGESLIDRLEGAGWSTGALGYTASRDDPAAAARFVADTFADLLDVAENQIRVEVRQSK